MENPRIRKYVWEFPVRFVHWLVFVCICVFITTGLYIGNPYGANSAQTTAYFMGYMRFFHFLAGYLFVCGLAIRTYWAFAGNKYSSWKVNMPYLFKDRMADLWDGLRFYTLMQRKPPYSVGHTAIAGLAYGILFLVFLFQAASGFAMLSLAAPGPFKMALGGWLLGVMDIQAIRLWHHMVTYVVIAFVFVHLYLAWWIDSAEKNGLMTSMFGGYKFVTGKEWE